MFYISVLLLFRKLTEHEKKIFFKGLTGSFNAAICISL